MSQTLMAVSLTVLEIHRKSELEAFCPSCRDKGKAESQFTTKLEIWGRAQHEAARRPKSDWKYNLWG